MLGFILSPQRHTLYDINTSNCLHRVPHFISALMFITLCFCYHLYICLLFTNYVVLRKLLTFLCFHFFFHLYKWRQW